MLKYNEHIKQMLKHFISVEDIILQKRANAAKKETAATLLYAIGEQVIAKLREALKRGRGLTPATTRRGLLRMARRGVEGRSRHPARGRRGSHSRARRLLALRAARARRCAVGEKPPQALLTNSGAPG